jgi:hypothetical protein
MTKETTVRPKSYVCKGKLTGDIFERSGFSGWFNETRLEIPCFTPFQNKIWYLKYFERMTYAEIAQRVCLKKTKVAYRLHAAKQKFKRYMENGGILPRYLQCSRDELDEIIENIIDEVKEQLKDEGRRLWPGQERTLKKNIRQEMLYSKPVEMPKGFENINIPSSALDVETSDDVDLADLLDVDPLDIMDLLDRAEGKRDTSRPDPNRFFFDKWDEED